MKKVVLAIAIIVLVAAAAVGGYLIAHKSDNATATSSSTNQPKPPTATKQGNLSTVMSNLQKQYTTVTQTYIYSETQDPNNALGKPGGYYIAGAEFYDTRTNTPPDGAVFGAGSGGAIEVYASSSDAAKRAAYLESFQSSPVLNPGAIKQVAV